MPHVLLLQFSTFYNIHHTKWRDLEPEFNQSSRLHGVDLKTMMVAHKPPGRTTEGVISDEVYVSL